MATEAGSIEVSTRGKRRYRTKLERRRIVEEVLEPGAKTAAVAKAHEIRASQVNHWRRLYEQGLLEVEARSTALVPVRISDAKGTDASKSPVASQTQSRSAIDRVAAGTIHLRLERAHLQIEGEADPCSLRVVLEHLLG